MTLILVYTLSKTILGHSFFNYILVPYTLTTPSISDVLKVLDKFHEDTLVKTILSQGQRSVMWNFYLTDTLGPASVSLIKRCP